jgi:1-deoxy-D-xylulose-5-phosphate reductoisomerase
LFDIGFDRIEVVVHPSSVVHSMVEFVDGSTMVQASPPDMRLPIALGLAWPERVPGAASACDWATATTWEFFPLDDSAFPAVRLARQAGEFGRTAPAVLNAANEVCVEAFVAGDLDFLGIVDTVGVVLEEHTSDPDVAHEDLTLAGVLEADARARERARALVDSR